MTDEMFTSADVHLDVVLDEPTKECAIKTASRFCAGSGVSVEGLCEAFFKREAEYSTGCGGGVAIPHAKIAGEVTPKVVVVRFAEPVEWGAIDDEPVRIAFCLVMPEVDDGNTHLKVVSKLARKLMVKEFVDNVLKMEDADELYGYVVENLEG